MTASMVTVGYTKMMLDKVNDSVHSKDLLGNSGGGGDIKGPLNFLMIGTDQRVGSKAEARTDSIMVLHVNSSLTEATIVSIPRDLRVEIANCGTLFSSPCQTKINDAYPAGGPSVEGSVSNLAETVTHLTGVSFDGAAIVNFEGFLDVVKTLGSVELCLPMEMTPAHAKGQTFPKGCNDYGYADALGIVRERYAYDPTNPEFDPSWGIGDYGRQHMQQHFVKQLLKRAAEKGYLSDPTKVGDLIARIGDQLTLDLGGHTPVDFAFALRGIKPEALATVKIPSEPADIEGVSYVVTQPGEQQETADRLYEAIRSDDLDKWIPENNEWVNKDD
ncbi:LCP family protein [Stackebrandtia nassauensis]|nr:LCP family protein [Stackebrandtia nassauensis]